MLTYFPSFTQRLVVPLIRSFAAEVTGCGVWKEEKAAYECLENCRLFIHVFNESDQLELMAKNVNSFY